MLSMLIIMATYGPRYPYRADPCECNESTMTSQTIKGEIQITKRSGHCGAGRPLQRLRVNFSGLAGHELRAGHKREVLLTRSRIVNMSPCGAREDPC